MSYVITQKYAVGLLISALVTKEKQTQIQISCYPEVLIKCKMKTSQKMNNVYKILPMVWSAWFIYFH